MIERRFVEERIKEHQVQEYIDESLSNVGHSYTKLQRTPLGEKIIIFAARPGLIVGRKGENIKKLTKNLKRKFNLENPQIEIQEVKSIFLDAKIVAEKIASTLERFGPQRFKGVGHKAIHDVMGAGARGIEILISGKIPGARAKVWRFYKGYLKKCGDVATTAVKTAYARAVLKTGVIGIRVKIMSADFRMPDDIQIRPEEEEVKEEAEEKKEEKKEEKPKKKSKKKAAKVEPSAKKTEEPAKEGATQAKQEAPKEKIVENTKPASKQEETKVVESTEEPAEKPSEETTAEKPAEEEKVAEEKEETTEQEKPVVETEETQ